MLKIHTTIGGPEEAKDPLLLCGICEALPELEVRIYDNAVQFCFSCPKCGFRSVPACGFKTAKKNWNVGFPEFAANQKRMDDF